MVVSPDLLLNTKAPATAAKTASSSSRDTSQASRRDSSSFADVYAKERQGRPAERRDDAPAAARNTPGKGRPEHESVQNSGTRAPNMAEAGNALPPEEIVEDAETELDPLLLLGLGGQAEGAVEPLPEAGSGLLALQGQISQAAAEAVLETEESLLAQRALVDAQAAMQKMLPAQGVAKAEESPPNVGTLSFKLVTDGMLSEDGEGFLLDEDVTGLTEQSAVSKESRGSTAEAAPDRLNALTQAITQQNLQAQRPALVPGQPLHMQQPNLNEAVVERVMWLSSQNLKSAEIQLDPAELGRMEIRIDMSKEHSQVTFLSPHAGVRDTLEGQMQRLRDMFAQQGMSMDVNVSDQSAQGREGDAESRDGRGVLAGGAGDDDEVHQGTLEISGGRAGEARGLVDFYA